MLFDHSDQGVHGRLAGAGPRLHVHDHRASQRGAVRPSTQEGVKEDQQEVQEVETEGFHYQQQQQQQEQKQQRSGHPNDQVSSCDLSRGEDHERSQETVRVSVRLSCICQYKYPCVNHL